MQAANAEALDPHELDACLSINSKEQQMPGIPEQLSISHSDFASYRGRAADRKHVNT